MSREMKHSGIEWIGEIPKEWKTISFSNGILRMSTGLNPRDNFELSKDDEYYYVTIKNFKDGKIYLDDNCDRISKQAWRIIQERSQLEKGDILFASISKDGQAYILEEPPVNWNINESVFCIRTNHDYFFDKYFYYHIIDSQFYNDLRLDATGTTFQSIKQNKLRKSTLCTPPLNEQQKIADYLDKVCGEVDELVTLQEQMIEELKAYKQSVITEAVTKGLNPNAPMKDSGVDWIGEIPEHWNYIKLGLLLQFKGGYAFNSDKYVQNSNNQVIRIGNVKNNLLLLDTSPVYVDDETAGIAKNYELKPGCILFTMTGTKGKRDYFYTLLLKKSDFCKKLYLNQRVGCFIAKMDICPNYYNYLLKDNRILDQVFLYETGTANQGNLGIESISRTMLHFPPIEEQQAIASYLDSKCSEIDALIAIKQQKIEELKDYKKSVIYEYVTGKKEVV